jgi:hypothetical protein
MVTARELHRKDKQWMMASEEQHLALAFAFCEQKQNFPVLAASCPSLDRLLDPKYL